MDQPRSEEAIPSSQYSSNNQTVDTKVQITVQDYDVIKSVEVADVPPKLQLLNSSFKAGINVIINTPEAFNTEQLGYSSEYPIDQAQQEMFNQSYDEPKLVVTSAPQTDAIIRQRPNFPSTAPKVFRTPDISVIASRQLKTQADVQSAMLDNQITFKSPKLFIRMVGFRFCVSDEQSSTRLSSTVAKSTSVPLVKQRKQRVMDVKIELTKFIDADYLIYNPESLVKYAGDKTHVYKQLKVFKYIASSKLKNICNVVREQFAASFDEFQCKIINDEFTDMYPQNYKGLFLKQTCSKPLTITLCTLMPLVLPLVAYEYVNKKEYHVGLVFRIKKTSIDEIQNKVLKIAQEAISPMDVNLRKLHHSENMLDRKDDIALTTRDLVSTV